MPEIHDFVPSGLREEYGHFHPEDRRRENHVGMEPFGFIEKLQSGLYTPTLTNVANLDSSSTTLCQWCRVGDTVTVSGRVQVDPTTVSVSTALRISLPVASDYADIFDCGGTAASAGVLQSAAISADTVNNEAQMVFIATDATLRGIFLYFRLQGEVGGENA